MNKLEVYKEDERKICNYNRNITKETLRVGQRLYFICPIKQNSIQETKVMKIYGDSFYVECMAREEFDEQSIYYFLSREEALSHLNLIRRIKNTLKYLKEATN